MATLHTPYFQVNSVTPTDYTRSLVFIDMAVQDYQSLAKGVISNTEVFVIQPTQNGVEQITEILATRADQNFSNIHIVCHGVPGSLQLGNTHLGLNTLDEYSQQLQQWQNIFRASSKTNKFSVKSAITSPTNLLIYGCNVADGDAGAEFIAKLHQLTGVNIAASRHLTGNLALGGNWNLEVRTSDMEVTLAFAETTREAYAGVLATFTVNNTGDADDGDPNNNVTTLREAINLANATPGNDAIAFGGVFTDSIPDVITLTSGQLTITDDVTILGTGASNLTVSGNNASRVFEILGFGKDVSIDGLKIANGNDSGILINAYTVVSLTNSNVSNNTTASQGGGINNKGTLKLTNTNVSDNTATSDGGGIVNQGILSLTRSSVSDNTASSNGGGISNIGVLSLVESSVSNNTATTNGGGISNINVGNFKLTNSTVSNNKANNGAGINNGQSSILSGATGTLTNSTVSGNEALGDGGGIYNFNSLSLINSTITNNTADSNGDGVGDAGGIFNTESGTYRYTLTSVGNTIIADNFDKSSSGNINPDLSGSTFRDSGNNLIGNQTGSSAFTTSTLVGTSASPIDPKLGPLQNNGGATLTHALLRGSPAINAGNNSLIATNITTDQRGVEFNRNFNGTVDIGAYEVQCPITSLPVNTDTVVTNTNDSGAGSLRQAILNANATAGADTITFAGSVFTDSTPDIITLTSGQLTITDDVTIVGTGASKLTISGNNASSVLQITGTGTDVSIDALKIANANDVIYGSILLNSNASLNLTNSIVSNNQGAVGGIFNRGNLSLTNTSVSGNRGSSLGGGVFNTGTLSLTNSTVSGNSAYIYNLFYAYGGGIFNTGNLKITASTISDNSAYASGQAYRSPNIYPSYGGGIYNSGTVDIIGSTISGNGARDGGGIFNDGTFSLTNSTVSNNRVDARGGGIYNNKGTLTLINDTITNNNATGSYNVEPSNGGVFNKSDSTVIVGNTIIAANFQRNVSTSDVEGDFIDLGNNLIGDNTGSTGFTISTLIGTSTNPIDPRLSALQNNGGETFTNALLADSPAINAGNNALIPAGITTDQRNTGFDRISEGTVDIGALEFKGLNGTNGPDNLVGNSYGDIIDAEAGNDTITGNQGNDILTGGRGQDKFVHNLGDGVDTITDFDGLGKGFNPSAAIIDELDTLKFQGTGLTARNLLLIQNGNNLEISFEGVADDKVILQNFALENLDNLWSVGNILFNGQSTIKDSFDVFDANSSQSAIFNKNTVTFLNDLNNNVNGFDNSDDVINGQEGDDRIDGKSGNDLLRGGAGNDILIGGVGDDILIGGADYDTLTGGSGDDQFVYQTFSYLDDTITDFNENEDKLVLTEAFKNLGYSGSNPIGDGYLQFVQSGTSTEVKYSNYGIGYYAFTLATLNNFAATNLVVGINVLV
jgi:CSLREA domain-containing protein